MMTTTCGHEPDAAHPACPPALATHRDRMPTCPTASDSTPTVNSIPAGQFKRMHWALYASNKRIESLEEQAAKDARDAAAGSKGGAGAGQQPRGSGGGGVDGGTSVAPKMQRVEARVDWQLTVGSPLATVLAFLGYKRMSRYKSKNAAFALYYGVLLGWHGAWIYFLVRIAQQ